MATLRGGPVGTEAGTGTSRSGTTRSSDDPSARAMDTAQSAIWILPGEAGRTVNVASVPTIRHLETRGLMAPPLPHRDLRQEAPSSSRRPAKSTWSGELTLTVSPVSITVASRLTNATTALSDRGRPMAATSVART